MSDWVNTVAPSLEQRTESNGGKCSQLSLQRPQLPSYQQQPRKAYLHRSFFIPPSNAPNWTVCQVCRVCQWMFTSHAFSVDLCRLKAFKALLLVMVVSESGSENATRQAAQNGETPLSHINSGTARSGKMIAGSSL